MICVHDKNCNAARNGGLIYTTGMAKGIPIGCLQEENGERVLMVKDHRRTDYISIDDLMTILLEYQQNTI